jgi:hypothetical protein
MPQVKTRAGKTRLSLYKAEQDRLRQSASDMRFIARNADDERLAAAADQASQSIKTVLESLTADTPAQDEPSETAKPELAKAS